MLKKKRLKRLQDSFRVYKGADQVLKKKRLKHFPANSLHATIVQIRC